MKKRYLLLILGLCFLNLSLFSIFGYSQYTTDLEYDFETDRLATFNASNFDGMYNVREQKAINGNYPAQYSFTDYALGNYTLNATNLDFVDSASIDSDCSLTIENKVYGHDKVLNLTDSSDSGFIRVIDDFGNHPNGIIEFWWLVNTTSDLYSYAIFAETSSSDSIFLSISEGYFRNYNGSEWMDIKQAKANRWYHNKIVFDCNEGSNSIFDWYIDGTKYADDLSFRADIHNINRAIFQSNFGFSNYFACFDAIDIHEPIINESYQSDYIDNLDNNVVLGGADTSGINFNKTYNNVFNVLDKQVDGQGFTYSNMKDNYSNAYFKFDWETEHDITTNHLLLNITSDSTNVLCLALLDKENGLFGDDIGFYNSTANFFDVTDRRINPNTNYTFEFFIDCEGNTWDFYVDDSIVLENIAFINNVSYVNNFTIYTESIFYCWNQYFSKFISYERGVFNESEIGRNLFPLNEPTGKYEVSADDFRFDKNGEALTSQTSDFMGWNETETDGDTVYAKQGAYSLEYDSVNNHLFKYWNTSANFLNISFSCKLQSGIGDNHLFYFYDENETLFLRFRYKEVLAGQYEFQFYNSSVSDWDTLIDSDYVFSDLFYVDLFIDFYSWDYIRADFYESYRDINHSFSLEFENDDCFGISKTEIIYDGAVGTNKFGLFSFGVSVDGLSLSDDVGYCQYDVGSWDVGNYQSFYYAPIDKKAYTESYYISEGFYESGYDRVNTTSNFNSDYCLIDDETIFSDAHLIYYFTTGEVFNETAYYPNFGFNFTIEGIYLSQGNNTYFLDFARSSDSLRESIFYVENSRLYYELYSKDNSLEYIEATFDLPNIPTDNFSAYLYGYKSNFDFKSFFEVEFVSGQSDVIEIGTYAQPYSSLLPELETIDSVILTVTDDDEVDSASYTRGYIYDFELKFIGSKTITFIVTNLIGLIIPLIVIVAPTVALYLSLESNPKWKGYGKNIILPFLFFMSMVAFMTGLIPLWVFIIICVGLSALILLNYKYGNKAGGESKK